MHIHEILIIKNGSENYGISTADINQISRVPLLMPLPLKPKSVRGLCAVAGTIVSLLDFNLLVDSEEVNYEASKTRLLSLNNEYSSNALLVSEVYDTVVIEQENIEYIEQKNNPVIGIYKYKEMLIQVMSLSALVAKINKVAIDSKEIKNGKTKQEVQKEEESNRFLIFSMYREKFALNIEYLQEIILADREITEILDSGPEVLGLITIRDELLIVIDLRVYYGFEAKKSDKNRILIASYDGKRVGLLIDDIIDIKSFPLSSVEYMSDAFSENKISGVIHAKDYLISFFDNTTLERIFSKNDSFIDEKATIKEELVVYEKEVIVFKLLSKEYAFEVESVDEIIDAIDATKVAFSDTFVDGIINIRGQIVILMSLFEKLGLPTQINEDSKIIICNINNARIGFVVDSVSDILSIKEADVHQQDGELFTDVLHLDHGKRLVLSMDIKNMTLSKDA
jgi:purine-binding chemotaxis protein CheW